MSRKRLLVYVSVALPLLAAAIGYRLAHKEEPFSPAAYVHRPGPIRLVRAYLQNVESACASFNRRFAADHRLRPHELVASFRRITPAPGYESLHDRLIKALEGAKEAEAALEFNSIAAFLDAVDCVAGPHSHPDLAYPPAPIVDGRTALSWDEFTAAIDGICADNNNRVVIATKLIYENRHFSQGQKNFSYYQLRSIAYRRLVRLFSRLGQPPDYSRPYREWMTVVEARTRAVAAQAFAPDVAHARRLDPQLAQLDGEENWFGQQMGLRVCSSNGPAFPPAGDGTRLG